MTVPASKLKMEVLRVLQAEGFIGQYEREQGEGHPSLKIQLRYIGEKVNLSLPVSGESADLGNACMSAAAT